MPARRRGNPCTGTNETWHSVDTVLWAHRKSRLHFTGNVCKAPFRRRRGHQVVSVRLQRAKAQSCPVAAYSVAGDVYGGVWAVKVCIVFAWCQIIFPQVYIFSYLLIYEPGSQNTNQRRMDVYYMKCYHHRIRFSWSNKALVQHGQHQSRYKLTSMFTFCLAEMVHTYTDSCIVFQVVRLLIDSIDKYAESDA